MTQNLSFPDKISVKYEVRKEKPDTGIDQRKMLALINGWLVGIRAHLHLIIPWAILAPRVDSGSYSQFRNPPSSHPKLGKTRPMSRRSR